MGPPAASAFAFTALAVLLPASLAADGLNVTLINSDTAGHPFSRFDVDGNSLDAHDGSLRLFGDTYYLYGTSYACGYEYQVNSNFCGFKVYSSPDLVHWTDRGLVVPPGDCRYCFRPHVLYNEATKTYVLWSDGGGGYNVYSSPSPTGPFTKRPTPALAVGGYVDLALFADADGKGYLLHNTTLVAASLTADMVVEPLTADYLGVTGQSVRLGLGDVEGFAAFQRRGRFHALMSDPSCAYCSGGTGEMTASSMMGPWSGSWYDPDGVHQSGRKEPRQRARLVNPDNCGGQPHSVLPVVSPKGDTTYLFVSDRWNTRVPNQGMANLFIGPLSFAPDGTLQDIPCVDRFTVELSVGTPGSYRIPADQDAGSGFEGFRHHCDIASAVQRKQTFTPTRDGILSRATATLFQGGKPDKAVVLEVLDGAGQVLHFATVPAASVPWAPKVIESRPNLPVKKGRTYALRIRSETTQGCYGWEYNDADPYAGGMESYSVDGGLTFTDEPKRDLKFTAEVISPSRAALRPRPAAEAPGGKVLGTGPAFKDKREAWRDARGKRLPSPSRLP